MQSYNAGKASWQMFCWCPDVAWCGGGTRTTASFTDLLASRQYIVLYWSLVMLLIKMMSHVRPIYIHWFEGHTSIPDVHEYVSIKAGSLVWEDTYSSEGDRDQCTPADTITYSLSTHQYVSSLKKAYNKLPLDHFHVKQGQQTVHPIT